jgi:DNA-binding XRE family transcriptional regulator
MMPRVTFKSRVKDLFDKSGKTQQQVAAEVHVEHETLNKYINEQGRRRDMRVVRRLAQVLGGDERELMFLAALEVIPREVRDGLVPMISRLIHVASEVAGIVDTRPDVGALIYDTRVTVSEKMVELRSVVSSLASALSEAKDTEGPCAYPNYWEGMEGLLDEGDTDAPYRQIELQSGVPAEIVKELVSVVGKAMRSAVKG